MGMEMVVWSAFGAVAVLLFTWAISSPQVYLSISSAIGIASLIGFAISALLMAGVLIIRLDSEGTSLSAISGLLPHICIALSLLFGAHCAAHWVATRSARIKPPNAPDKQAEK